MGVDVKDLFGAGGVSDLLKSAIERIWPDKTKAAELKAEVDKAVVDGRLKEDELFASLDKGQQDINKIEAANPSLFVSGWRPAVGWVCVASLATYFLPRFLLGMFFWCKIAWSAQVLPPMPDMGIADILGLVTTLLGSSLIRMREKEGGVARV